MPPGVVLTVIVPVRNAEATLDATLAAIRRSLISAPYELLVVDDVSEDKSVSLAARYADTVVRLSDRAHGPAYARNRGAELSRGEIIAFIDSDVLVEPDTLEKMLSALRQRPEIDGISATRHEIAGAPNFASQYWNLLLRFGEERNTDGMCYFAPSCGMIRREVLLSAGMYDEWRFVRGSVEGVELAGRLRGAGRNVVAAPSLRVQHLKAWTLLSMCREVWRRSLMLARSLGYERTRSAVPGEVVFTLSRALAPAFAAIVTLTLTASFIARPDPFVKTLLVMGVILLTNLPVHRFFLASRGFAFAILSAPIHLCVQAVSGLALCAGWVLRDAVGDILPDAKTQAYSEVGLEIWPPVRRRL
jgi:hypothetical protein